MDHHNQGMANHHDQHDHDAGLAHDLKMLERQAIGRRRALWLFASAGAVPLVQACGGGSSSSSSSTVTLPTPTPTATATPTPTPTPTATSTSSTTCTVPATETNGPYPADGTNTSSGLTSNALVVNGITRADIRPSFLGSSTAVAAGVQTSITITVVDANNGCAPLVGYAVYLWHCDRDGKYSLYDLPNESYLRGVQITDSRGQVTFTTIFPGCYAGRFPHIHFEIFSSAFNATNGRSAVLISQFALPAAACTDVYNNATGYTTSRSNFASTSIASDNVFGDNSTAQMTVMTLTATGSASAGYTASSTIGIAT